MSKKRPWAIMVDSETHKKLKIMSAWENRPMGDIVIELVCRKYENRTNRFRKTHGIIKYPGGVIQNDQR